MTLADALAAGRPVPWLFELAAELEGESVDDLHSDAGAVARSLSGAAELFDLPAVCVSFDTTLEAEAVGCAVEDGAVTGGVIETVDDAFDVDVGGVTVEGRIPTVVDAVDRLVGTTDAAVLGGVTGPALLAEHLLADPDDADLELREEAMFTAGELAVELANDYLDAGADGVAVLEPTGLDAPLYRDAAEPVANVLDHFEGTGVVVTEQVSAEDVRTAAETGFDAITGGVDAFETVEDALEVADDAGVELGVGVSRAAFADGPEAVAAAREDAPAGTVLSSEWTVPEGTAPEAVHELMDSW
ncbi:MAG: uroporphyrinogen decarboxylase family protein [Haloferacaceae archaeon]